MGYALLLGCDGTNGSTSFPDSSPFGHTITPTGSPTQSTTSPIIGSASGVFGSGKYLVTANHTSAFAFGGSGGMFSLEVN